jgi:hypothetical protein
MPTENRAADGQNTAADDAAATAEALARQDPANTPRMQAMSAIAKKHEDDIEQQLAAEGLSSRTTHGELPMESRTPAEIGRGARGHRHAAGAADHPAAPPAGQDAGDQRRPQAVRHRPGPDGGLDGLQVRMKIDGVDRVLTMQELRRTAQLDGAAHARLEQANKLLQEARTAAAATPKPPVGVEGKTGTGDSSLASEDVTAAANSLVDALFVGDKDAAVATVKKLLAGAQPAAQQFDPEAIARQVAPAVRQQLSQEEAEAQFRSDFKDVVKDPLLVSVADRFFEEAMAIDPQKSYAEALTEAGNSTRQWLATQAGTTATGPGTRNSRQGKLEAKAKIDEVNALSRTDVTQEPSIPSHSQVIADMRKQRGLEA